jgi:transposase
MAPRKNLRLRALSLSSGRAMETEIFLGLDVHRKSVVATAIDGSGQPIAQRKLGPTDSELTEFLDSLPGIKHVALEACAMWEHYFDVARASGADVVLSNPYKTRLIAEATIKTDKVDSESIATLLRLHSLPTVYTPTPELRALRLLVRDRVFFARKTHDLQNHIYYFLVRRGIAYEDGVLRHRRRRELLRELGLPEVDRSLDALNHLQETVKTLEKAIHEAFLASPEAQLLETIPGIGELTAIGLVAFLCPIERFPTIDRLSSYVGLAPTTYQSADRLYHGHLKRDSNGLVRWLLVEAAWTHRQRARTSDVAKVGRRVSRRRGTSKGSVAAAHKLLKIIFAILKERRPYLPHAPERTTAMQRVRDPPPGIAAVQRVRRAALGSSAADCLSAQ